MNLQINTRVGLCGGDGHGGGHGDVCVCMGEGVFSSPKWNSFSCPYTRIICTAIGSLQFVELEIAQRQ